MPAYNAGGGTQAKQRSRGHTTVGAAGTYISFRKKKKAHGFADKHTVVVDVFLSRVPDADAVVTHVPCRV